MTTVADNIRLTRHVGDLDDDGHDTFAAGMAPNILYCELNSPPSGNAQVWDWDTFYDKDQNDITATIAAALAAIGLTYSAGAFTATEDGVWACRVAFAFRVAPSTQQNLVHIVTDMLAVDEAFTWDAATQLLTPPNDRFLTENVYLNSGEQISGVIQEITNLTDPLVADYATMSIIRLQ